MLKNKITKHSLTKWSVYTEVIIDAPIEKVWKELTNFKEMALWSTSLQNLSGDFKKNGIVEVDFMDDKGKVAKYKHKLVHFEEGKLFGWSDPFIMGITDNHTYQLEKISSTQTKFIQSDEANGFATLFLGKMITNFFLTAYTDFNKNLKQRVEKE
jgi:hypothetical protein